MNILTIRFCLAYTIVSFGVCHIVPRSTNVAAVFSRFCMSIAFAHSGVSDSIQGQSHRPFFIYLRSYDFHLSYSRACNCLSDARNNCCRMTRWHMSLAKVLFTLSSVDHIGISFTNKKNHGFYSRYHLI